MSKVGLRVMVLLAGGKMMYTFHHMRPCTLPSKMHTCTPAESLMVGGKLQMHKLRPEHLQRLQVCVQKVHLHILKFSHSRIAQPQGLSPVLS